MINRLCTLSFVVFGCSILMIGFHHFMCPSMKTEFFLYFLCHHILTNDFSPTKKNIRLNIDSISKPIIFTAMVNRRRHAPYYADNYCYTTDIELPPLLLLSLMLFAVIVFVVVVAAYFSFFFFPFLLNCR